jgi:protocatechuate 3,4-dioxygenase beta subunit
MINLFPAAPEPSLMMFGGSTTAATVDAGGRFTIKDVFPGSYRISASFPGATGAPGWVVHSATVEGEDVLDTPLDVGGRTAVTGMVVTMTDRLTELSGIVVDEKGKPATDQTLVLYPVDEKYRVFQSRRIRTTRAGEDGRYTFRMIPPGDYRLATVLDPEPGSWYDKAVLGDLDSSAVRVSLAEGEKKIENVRVR